MQFAVTVLREHATPIAAMRVRSTSFDDDSAVVRPGRQVDVAVGAAYSARSFSATRDGSE